MGLRNILSRRRKAAESADLEAAWVALRQTVDDSHLKSFRVCSRNGRSWAEDPETVRQVAATIRRVMNERAEGPKDEPAR